MRKASLFTHGLRALKRLKRLTQFLILMSFLITFGLARLTTHLQKLGVLPSQHRELHIHHLVPGIFFLLLSGYIGLSFWNHYRWRILMAILFGVGAALTIDEFALWLYLKDVYWEKQGRDSVDLAIITITVLALVFILGQVYDHVKKRKHEQLEDIDEDVLEE